MKPKSTTGSGICRCTRGFQTILVAVFILLISVISLGIESVMLSSSPLSSSWTARWIRKVLLWQEDGDSGHNYKTNDRRSKHGDRVLVTTTHSMPSNAYDDRASQEHKNTSSKTATGALQDAFDWVHQWLVEGTNGEPARIYFAHVGKTGGTSLEKSVLLNRLAKSKSLPCLMRDMQRWMAQNRNDYQPTHDKNTTSVPSSVMEKIWWTCLNDSTSQLERLASKAGATMSNTATITHIGRQVWFHKHIEEPYRGSVMEKAIRYFSFHVANTFLFTVRSPISRIVSAFHYHQHRLSLEVKRPAKNRQYPLRPMDAKFLLQCYKTMDDVAQALLRLQQANGTNNNPQPEHDTSCLTLARQVLSGQAWSLNSQSPMDTRPKLTHFQHNYQYYLRETIGQRPEIPIVVVRMESLWDDVRRLNNALIRMNETRTSQQQQQQQQRQMVSSHRRTNGTGMVDDDDDVDDDEIQFLSNLNIHITHGSEQYANSGRPGGGSSSSSSRGISTVEGRRAVCCHIYQDLEAYQTIILRALNLKETEKRVAIQQMLEECGVVGRVSYPTTLTQTNQRQQQQQQQLLKNPFSWNRWYNQTCSVWKV